MAKVTCKACGKRNSYNSSPSKNEGYFISEDNLDGLYIDKHKDFDTMHDFVQWLNKNVDYGYKCSCNCVTLILD